MLAATLRSILNSPPSLVWGTSAEHFYKSAAFVTPSPSSVPVFDTIMDVTLGSRDINSKGFKYKSEMTNASPKPLSIQEVVGCLMSETGGILMSSINVPCRLAADCRKEVLSLSFSSPSIGAKLSSYQLLAFSHRDSATSNAMCNTSSDLGSHADGILSWPRPVTPPTPPNVMFFRRTGEKKINHSSAPPAISGIALSRMR